MREFIFYTRDPAFVETVLAELRTELSSHDLQSYIAEDQKWGLFRQFA
jgi:hypothetical protein